MRERLAERADMSTLSFDCCADIEIQSIQVVDELMGRLSKGEKERVLRWACDKHTDLHIRE